MKSRKNIGLFYGSDTGYTEAIAKLIAETIGIEKVELFDIAKCKKQDFEGFELIIIGLSTWHDGQLQSDWDTFLADFKAIDFSGKTIALFGLGDQEGYGEYFVDGIGILGLVIYENGGQIVGVWPTDGYSFESSKAEFQEGWFMGLAIDEDNQSDLTLERVQVWVDQVLEEFEEVAIEKREV